MKKSTIQTTQVRIHIRFEKKHLLEKVAAGDSRAAHVLVQRYGNRVWSIALRLLGSEDEALLATRRIFAVLRQHAQYYQASRLSETLFITIIARRFCLKQKQNSKKQTIFDQYQNKITENNPTKIIGFPATDTKKTINFSKKWKKEFSHESVTVLQAMKQISKGDQQLLKLHMIYGLSSQNLAYEFNLPLVIVQSRIKTGISVIMQHLSTFSPEKVVWH